ncbi:RNI-like protein [Dipodascopsis tothii]|uniref:RNI-like protein n=1 Tax=Dipodascopsis tothii TaxID=44089 RepID=UPI0034CF79F8
MEGVDGTDGGDVATTADEASSTDSPASSVTTTPHMFDSMCVGSLAHPAMLPPEILFAIFSYLSAVDDIKTAMLVCKAWSRCAVELLWYRPNLHSIMSFVRFNQTVSTTADALYYPYGRFIKRLNLNSISKQADNGFMHTLARACGEIERLTLSNCQDISDDGVIPLVTANPKLLAVDVSHLTKITDRTVLAIAKACPNLQGFNLTGCASVTDDVVVTLAQSCRHLRRIKLFDCALVTDRALDAIADNCPNVMEVDLHGCKQITNAAVTKACLQLHSLREFRLALNPAISDDAFLYFRDDALFESFRILDLTGCNQLTDASVQRIVAFAPRLRNLVLAKCTRITDRGVLHITKLGKTLHYLHLGHCSLITDSGIAALVRGCTRIRYIDLACCTQLTNAAVEDLATLPKLRRIGLVKCVNITDEAIHALAQRRAGALFALERVHLSYCTNLSLMAILSLINAYPRLTHLSLTGVPAFLRPDLTQFCRPAPPEFNQHQQAVFCVFSGQGVVRLRQQLNRVTAEHRHMVLGQQLHDRQALPHNDFEFLDDEDEDEVEELNVAMDDQLGRPGMFLSNAPQHMLPEIVRGALAEVFDRPRPAPLPAHLAAPAGPEIRLMNPAQETVNHHIVRPSIDANREMDLDEPGDDTLTAPAFDGLTPPGNVAG